MRPDLAATYAAAVVRYHEAVGGLIPVLRRVALAEVVEVVPGGAQLVTFGGITVDGVPILRVRRVLGEDGAVLVDLDRGSVRVETEERLHFVGSEYLDVLLDLTGSQYLGEHTWPEL